MFTGLIRRGVYRIQQITAEASNGKALRLVDTPPSPPLPNDLNLIGEHHVNNNTIEARKEAARALEGGRQLAERAAARRRGQTLPDRPEGAALGDLLSDPTAFWAGAVAVEAFGDGDTVGPVLLAQRLAVARLAAGDLNHVRGALLGQSQWLGVLAVKLAALADVETRPDRQFSYLKLAMQAQRQAAAALCSAAALNKLTDEDTAVSVSDSD